MTEVVFRVTNHSPRIHMVEALLRQTGYLTLTRLVIDSCDREEHLLFSGLDDSGRPLDQETMEKLFNCSGRAAGFASIPQDIERRLQADAAQHAKATISKSLERNNAHFNQAREKLEKWADDMVMAAEKALTDTKEQFKELRREARQTATLEQQHEIQEKLQKLERQQRRQRQEIFNVEDQIMERRDALIDQLEKRLSQRTESESLFIIRWRVA